MTLIAKNGIPSIGTLEPDPANKICADIFAGEFIGGGDACYISPIDGRAYKAFAATSPTGIEAINVADGGQNYTIPPTVAIDAPLGGGPVQAVAEAIIDQLTHTVRRIIITTAGAGYNAVPVVTLTPDANDPGVNGIAPQGGTAVAVLQDEGNAAAVTERVRGFAAKNYFSNQPVTLLTDVNFGYGSGLTPGKDVFLSAAVPGGLDDVQTGSLPPCGFTLDGTRIRVWYNRSLA